MNAYEKMREALEATNKFLEAAIVNGKVTSQDISRLRNIVSAALFAPPRNCDVGTPEEQKMRMRMFCKGRHCDDCVFRRTLDCRFDWAQMPYKEGGSK